MCIFQQKKTKIVCVKLRFIFLLEIFMFVCSCFVNVYKEELDKKMKEEMVSKNNIKLMKKIHLNQKNKSISSAFRSMSIAKDFLMIWHTFSSS